MLIRNQKSLNVIQIKYLENDCLNDITLLGYTSSEDNNFLAYSTISQICRCRMVMRNNQRFSMCSINLCNYAGTIQQIRIGLYCTRSLDLSRSRSEYLYGDFDAYSRYTYTYYTNCFLTMQLVETCSVLEAGRSIWQTTRCYAQNRMLAGQKGGLA